MVEFSVRIDFYRDLEGPKDYVGSALRDGLSAVVLPGSASMYWASAPTPGAKAPMANPTAWSRPSSTASPQRGSLTRPRLKRRRTRPSCSCFRRCGRVMAPWPAHACCGSTTLRAAGSSTSSATTPRSSHSRATRSWAGSTSKAGDAHEQPASDRDPGGRHVPRRVAGSPHPHQPGSARASGRTWRCSTPSPRATRAEPPAGRLAAGRLARRDCRHNRCHDASGPPTRRDLLVPTDRIWEQ